jgi:hypothetical protein
MGRGYNSKTDYGVRPARIRGRRRVLVNERVSQEPKLREVECPIRERGFNSQEKSLFYVESQRNIREERKELRVVRERNVDPDKLAS